MAAVSVLLSFGTTPCAIAGRTHLRGGSAAPTAAEKRANYSGGKRIRGGGGGGRRLQATAAPAAAPAAAGNNTAAAGGNNTAAQPEPNCTTLFVPAMAENLTGSYTFEGRYNNRHPVYTDSSTGNNIFYGDSHFYITQPSARLFLALETDVFEPADLGGLHQWVRYNDPTCETTCPTSNLTSNLECQTTCPTWNIRLACTIPSADVTAAATPAPTAGAVAATPGPTPTAGVVAATPSPTAGAVAANAMDSNSASPAEAATPTPAPTTALYNSTSSLTETSAIDGCVNLNIQNGAARAGVYALNTNAGGDAVLINGRPSYIGVGVGRTADQVFTVLMDVCAAGWGAVNATWAEAVGDLGLTASANAVFLMYVAEHGGLDLANPAGCEVPVWFVTSGGGGDLDVAGEDTFLSLSDVEDPSDATSWAKFTPANETSRPTLVENSWIEVGCAEANELQEALEGEGAGAGAGAAAGAGAGAGGGEENVGDVAAEPTPVGSEPNGSGRRLRGKN